MSNEALTNDSEDIVDNRLESYDFFPVRFICFIISFAALYLIVMGNMIGVVIGLIFLFMTFPIAIMQKRITVDLTNNKYREYHTFLGIKIGKWYSFKGFKIITITHSDKAQRMNAVAGGAEAYSNSTEFYLNLKKDNYNKINIASGSYKSMLKKAIALAHRYELGIMDCSEKPNKKYSYEEVVQKFPK